MWFLTVFGLMCSSPAICALSLPFAISFSTWISRSESSARMVAAASGAAVVARTRWSTLPAMCGEISDSPTAAERIPRHQILDRRVLEQVAARAREDRVHHVLLLVRDREHDHAGQRRVAADVARGLDAGHPRHVQVHDDDVGRRARGRAATPPRRSPPRRRSARPAPRAGCGARSGRGRGRRRAARGCLLRCVLDRCDVGQRCLLDSGGGVQVYVAVVSGS